MLDPNSLKNFRVLLAKRLFMRRRVVLQRSPFPSMDVSNVSIFSDENVDYHAIYIHSCLGVGTNYLHSSILIHDSALVHTLMHMNGHLPHL